MDQPINLNPNSQLGMEVDQMETHPLHQVSAPVWGSVLEPPVYQSKPINKPTKQLSRPDNNARPKAFKSNRSNQVESPIQIQSQGNQPSNNHYIHNNFWDTIQSDKQEESNPKFDPKRFFLAEKDMETNINYYNPDSTRYANTQEIVLDLAQGEGDHEDIEKAADLAVPLMDHVQLLEFETMQGMEENNNLFLLHNNAITDLVAYSQEINEVRELENPTTKDTKDLPLLRLNAEQSLAEFYEELYNQEYLIPERTIMARIHPHMADAPTPLLSALERHLESLAAGRPPDSSSSRMDSN